jgi:hypothetical protein
MRDYWLYVDVFLLHVSFALKNFVIMVQDFDGCLLIYAKNYDSCCLVPTATIKSDTTPFKLEASNYN